MKDNGCGVVLTLCAIVVVFALVMNDMHTPALPQWCLDHPRRTAFLFAMSITLTFIALFSLAADASPLRLMVAFDKRPSTSRCQFFIWTWSVVLGLLYMMAGRYLAHRPDALTMQDLPFNVLIAMGLSTAVAEGSKAITISYVFRGEVSKTTATEGSGSWRCLVAEDDGTFSLTKMQVLMWTAIAVALFLVCTHVVVGKVIHDSNATSPAEVPDIDASLMVLMGIAQGSYIGRKLVTKDAPRLQAVQPARVRFKPSAPQSQAMELQGWNLSGTTFVLVNDREVPATTISTDKVAFQLPINDPKTNLPWAPPQQVKLAITANGMQSNAVVLLIDGDPTLTSVTPSPAAEGASLTALGTDFSRTSNEVLFGSKVVATLASPNETTLVFPMPKVAAGSVLVSIRVGQQCRARAIASSRSARRVCSACRRARS